MPKCVQSVFEVEQEKNLIQCPDLSKTNGMVPTSIYEANQAVAGSKNNADRIKYGEMLQKLEFWGPEIRGPEKRSKFFSKVDLL